MSRVTWFGIIPGICIPDYPSIQEAMSPGDPTVLCNPPSFNLEEACAIYARVKMWHCTLTRSTSSTPSFPSEYYDFDINDIPPVDDEKKLVCQGGMIYQHFGGAVYDTTDSFGNVTHWGVSYDAQVLSGAVFGALLFTVGGDLTKYYWDFGSAGIGEHDSGGVSINDGVGFSSRFFTGGTAANFGHGQITLFGRTQDCGYISVEGSPIVVTSASVHIRASEYWQYKDNDGVALYNSTTGAEL